MVRIIILANCLLILNFQIHILVSSLLSVYFMFQFNSMGADYHAVIHILLVLCSLASKLGCCSSHTNKNAMFYLCCQVETICCGNWRETSNSRVSHQQKVQINTLTVIRNFIQALGRFAFHRCNVSEHTFLLVINLHLKTLEMMLDTQL